MTIRITLEDSVMSATIKLSDQNPGAIGAMVEMCKASPVTDPENFAGDVSPLLSLDQHNIYGTDIYVLFSDICEGDPVKALAVLRAVQLGFLEESTLQDACSRQDRSGKRIIDVDGLYSKVKNRLPSFDSQEI